MGQPSPSHSDRRLDSWKEIAAFFGRDERTVRRWEKESALPVRRVPGGAKGRVFAYESELRNWLSTPQVAKNSEDNTAVLSEQGGENRDRSGLLVFGKWAAVLALCGALIGGIFIYRKSHRFAVHAAETHVTRTNPQTVRPLPPSDAEDFYLKGRYFWNKRTPEDLNKAVDLFTQAIVRDPGYAQAYVGLADCYNLLREYSAMPPGEAYPRALAAAKEAVKLDDTSAEAHNSLAFATFYWEWDAVTAEREFKRAIELNPNYVAARHWYATFLLATRRYQEAVSAIETARKLDPSSKAIMADRAFILYWEKQPEGIESLKQMEAAEPAFLSPHLYLAEIHFRAQEYAEYLSESIKVAQLRHDQHGLAILKAGESGLAAAGVRGMWKGMLPVQRKLYLQGALPPYALARTYSALGEQQVALTYLREAYDKRDVDMLLLKSDDVFDDLRENPTFNDLLARSTQPRLD